MRPRWRLAGLARDWTPRCPAPVAAPVAPWQPETARSQPVETYTPASPVRENVEGWQFARADSHTIGWFDLDRYLEIRARLREEGSEYGASPASSPAPPSPEEDFIRRLAAALQPPLSALCAPHGVLDWPAPLLPYQREGIGALLSRRELLLADDMGLGKTIQAIAALRILCYQQQIESALVVCPASLVRQWRRELGRWAAELKVVLIAGSPAERGSLWRVPAHVKLVSYETLRADVMDLRDSPVLRQEWGVVVLDEASRIKNRDTGIAIACKRLPRQRRWALTGTPMENQWEDVISLLEFLLGDPGKRVGGLSTLSAVRAQLQRLQLRRKKEDVLRDLPAKQVNELVVELPPSQRAAYDRAEQEGILHLKEAGATVTITHVLELITHLKQLCNVEPVTGESAKLADIAQRLRTLTSEGHRALLFSQFTDDTFGIAHAAACLKEFRPLQFTGSMSAGRKAEVVARFVADARHKALLLSLRAGGVGLNLQAASYVFHLDRWWNPAIEEQADSRAHRMGQPYPVTVYRYICADTIEERIDRTLKEKRQMFQDLVDDVSLDIALLLNEQEIFGLFGLASPPRAEKGRRPAGAEQVPFTRMSGREFEEWVAGRLQQEGFQVELTPASRDGGVDLIASRADALQIETRLFIQCKNHREPVGVGAIRELRGVVPDRSAGVTPVVVCPGGFTAEATAFAADNGVCLWGTEELRQLERQASQRPSRQSDPPSS
jgi:HJR/Mrr/RecB family endonuclease